MKWLKHYSNASTSIKLNLLIDELGVDGYGRYWLLLELLSEKFNGKEEPIPVHFSEISAKVRIKFGKKLATFLQKLVDFQLITFELSGKVYKIECPILWDLKAKDFGRARTEREVKAIEPPLRIKNKDKRIKSSDAPEVAAINEEERLEKILNSKPNQIAAFYNDIAKELKLSRVVVPLESDRVTLVNKALKEFPNPSDWENIIVQIGESPFNLGKNNRGWKANFDWLFGTTKKPYRKLWEAYESENS